MLGENTQQFRTQCVWEQARLLLDRIRLLGDSAAEAAALRERQVSCLPTGEKLQHARLWKTGCLFTGMHYINVYFILKALAVMLAYLRLYDMSYIPLFAT